MKYNPSGQLVHTVINPWNVSLQSIHHGAVPRSPVAIKVTGYSLPRVWNEKIELQVFVVTSPTLDKINICNKLEIQQTIPIIIIWVRF
jgi:hypothetical protein